MIDMRSRRRSLTKIAKARKRSSERVNEQVTTMISFVEIQTIYSKFGSFKEEQAPKKGDQRFEWFASWYANKLQFVPDDVDVDAQISTMCLFHSFILATTTIHDHVPFDSFWSEPLFWRAGRPSDREGPGQPLETRTRVLFSSFDLSDMGKNKKKKQWYLITLIFGTSPQWPSTLIHLACLSWSSIRWSFLLNKVAINLRWLALAGLFR